MRAQRGDTLIEVIISALVIGVIVAGLFTGLDSVNRSTSLDRARSQADALAEQNEEQLRSESIVNLDELTSHPTVLPVTENGTTFTITTTAEYIADSTATSSCSSTAAKADYLQTISKITWPSMGASKPVIETGEISPPADAALIVQVTDEGTAVPEAEVVATGPLPETAIHKLETSSNGCAILALPPGEYSVNVSKTGWVDFNGYPNSSEDASVTKSVYLPAETTARQGFNLGQAGKLSVSFTGSTPSEGDTFVAFDSAMTVFKTFGTLNTYASTIESPKTLFPFASKYTVYPGTCEADIPPSSVIEANKHNFTVAVPAGGTASITTIDPPIALRVLESNKGQPERPLQNALVRLEDTGCKTVHESRTNSTGELPRPGMPFGTYALCVNGVVGTQARKYKSTLTSTSATGTPLQTLYLGEEGEVGTGC